MTGLERYANRRKRRNCGSGVVASILRGPPLAVRRSLRREGWTQPRGFHKPDSNGSHTAMVSSHDHFGFVHEGAWRRSRPDAGFDATNPDGGPPYRVGLAQGEEEGFVFWTRHAGPFFSVLTK